MNFQITKKGFNLLTSLINAFLIKKYFLYLKVQRENLNQVSKTFFNLQFLNFFDSKNSEKNQ